MHRIRVTPEKEEYSIFDDSSSLSKSTPSKSPPFKTGAGREFLEVRGKEFHHLARVLRVQIGQEVEVKLPDREGIYLTNVAEFLPHSIKLELHGIRELSAQPSIVLLVGNIKPSKAELLVQQCASAGVTHFCFFQAHRSQGQYELVNQTPRYHRLQKTATETHKQSGFSSDCKISAFCSLEACINSLVAKDFSLRFLLSPPAHEEEHRSINLISNSHIQNIINSRWANNEQKELECKLDSADSVVIVGPEGGLSESEINLARKCRFEPVSIGLNTYRTETAALAATLLLSLVCSPA